MNAIDTNLKMAPKNKVKFYVVWRGVKPGIYEDWNTCKNNVAGFEGARYKSFETKAAATLAFRGNMWDYLATGGEKQVVPTIILKKPPHTEAWCVDAACSGNPGDMEYRGVDYRTREQLFHVGPLTQGTNNIGEFLAIVHALALLKRAELPNMPIYTDSKTAIAWVRNQHVKTQLAENQQNKKIFDMIDKGLFWLHNNSFQNPIIKWETAIWGEIPADFGRK
jgi:ribonuclease HI